VRTTTCLIGESILHIAARTLAGSTYHALAPYLAALIAANTGSGARIVDWTALQPGTVLTLPA